MVYCLIIFKPCIILTDVSGNNYQFLFEVIFNLQFSINLRYAVTTKIMKKSEALKKNPALETWGSWSLLNPGLNRHLFRIYYIFSASTYNVLRKYAIAEVGNKRPVV